MELSQLQGVGKARLEAMHAAGILSLRDLLYTLPVRYRDVSAAIPAGAARAGVYACFFLRRVGEPKLVRFGNNSRVTSLWEDDTGELECTWFNQPWMKENLIKRTTALLYGRVERYGSRIQLVNPSLEDETRIMPVYRPIGGLPQKIHENLVKQAIAFVEAACPETITEKMLRKYNLYRCADSLHILHAPQNMEDIEPARRRIAFEQMLLYQTAVRMIKNLRRRGIPLSLPKNGQEAYWNLLSFEPTAAQRRTLQEIARDMASNNAMARMVQGDVGCGKTAVAVGAIQLCAAAGYQSALMAPTEILARQHYEHCKAFFTKQGVACGILTGGMGAVERREAIRHIASGHWQVVIGTHALISKDVVYQRLGLCITDEQHRFGVGQRTALLNKGLRAEGAESCSAHLLVMSATPIPRSLALIMFGDLDVSVVDELPPGRLPVATRIVPEEKRGNMYAFLRKMLDKGQQAYIVCPLVDESEADAALKAVTSHVAELQRGPLKGFKLGFTHGKQKSEEKERIISAFAEGKVQVLVTTTVIEVGVNVPAATAMIVEDADRYGLAQLHQLRGRVGRGSAKSWCFLLARENERLRALTKTNDGFEIARKDLELRGPGEILGSQQHGAGRTTQSVLYGDMGL
ncbi:MAG: ATP-dependent DNA helicase RecG, partial [Clostridia bacterium]|nr:ATP-dependent DNA helicase RecG [Clostridia bacterium]